MAASLRPRRGKRSTAISKGIILKRGEIFFESPDTGIGTGAGNIVMGDGVTVYEDLPYFLKSSGGGKGIVETVNYIGPDDNGNINLVSVPLAENILSPDNATMSGAYIFRTSGGTADINSGDANILSIVGNCEVDKISGAITVATPYSFKSIGLNQFNPDSEILVDRTINVNGEVVSAIGSYVVAVHAVGGLNNGYIVFSNGGFISRVGWNPVKPDAASTGIIVTADTDNVTEIINNNRKTYITNVHEGYICIACTNTVDLCVHPVWSGIKDEEFDVYKESEILIPTTDINGLPLPTATYGMPAVGAVADELNFDNRTYTKKIGYYPFTPANLALVQAMGVGYINDTQYIFYILKQPEVHRLAESVTSLYTVNDFGTEEFTQTSIPMLATHVYGQNLRDKLRRDVVTISPLKISSSGQEQVRNNIGAFADLPNFEEAEDIPTEQLLDVISSGNKMSSILGSIKRLLHRVSSQVKSSVSSVNSIGPDEYGNVEINKVPLADNLFSEDNKEVYNKYIFRTAGGESDISSGFAQLSYLKGNAVLEGYCPENIKIVAASNYIPSPEETYIYIYAQIDNNIWRNSTYGQASGEYVYNFNGTEWLYNNTDPVNLVNIGITVSGDIKSNDTITVSYTKLEVGNIKIANPSAYKIIGMNQFNKDTNVLMGYTIDANGKVQIASGSNYICFAKVPYANTSYVAYSSSSAILNIAFSTTIPGAGDILELSGAIYSPDLSTYTVSREGYICVACTDYNGTLCIHPRWSGTQDLTYENYTEFSITLPTIDKWGQDLPTKTYGIPGIFGIRDEINFDLKQYIKRIGYLPYSAENLEHVISMSVLFMNDNNTILYVLPEPIYYTLNDNITGSYVVSDFGTEQFVGTTLELYSANLYGQNLRDKLRRDVVTISAQTLTPDQQTQVRNNINAASIYDLQNVQDNMMEYKIALDTDMWVSNASPARLKYKCTINNVSFTQRYNIFWRIHGATNLPTDTEAESIAMITEVVFNTNSVDVYATALPTVRLYLGVVGGR